MREMAPSRWLVGRGERPERDGKMGAGRGWPGWEMRLGIVARRERAGGEGVVRTRVCSLIGREVERLGERGRVLGARRVGSCRLC